MVRSRRNHSHRDHSLEFDRPMNRTSQDHADHAPEAAARPGPASRRRRRMLVGGASTAVLVTLAGRPAWGSSCTPSALASANASGRHDYSTCAGKSAGYWKDVQRWPGSVNPKDRFHLFFGGNRFGDLTLGEVINLPGGPSSGYRNFHEIGLHTVGAFVNAHAFRLGSLQGDFGYTPQQIVDIYNFYSAAEAAAFFEQINNQFDF